MNIIKRIGVIFSDIKGHGLKKVDGFSTGWDRDGYDGRDLVVNSHGQVTKACDAPLDITSRADDPDVVDTVSLKRDNGSTHMIIDPRDPIVQVRNQLKIGSCASFAGAAHHAVVVKLSTGANVWMSPRYLYLVTRRLAGRNGDTGSTMRDVVRAMKVSGVPPERIFPYDGINKNPLSGKYYDKNPSWFIQAASKANRVAAEGRYMRLDTPVARRERAVTLIENMCSVIATNMPIMGGFYLADSGDDLGVFRTPKSFKEVVGGHAMLIVGYDRHKRMFHVMNSWGAEWGVNGFGQLSFDFVKEGFSSDFWVVDKYEYTDSAAFSMTRPMKIVRGER